MSVFKSTVLAIMMVTLASCGKSEEKASSGQVAAIVDGKEISVLQLNQVMKSMPNVTAENAEAVRKKVLERLIDQQIVLNKALEEKTERSAEVVSAIEAAKRDVITRAYLTNLVGTRVKPAPQQVKAYFDSHPELFTARKIYNLQDIALPPGTMVTDELKAQVEHARGLQEVAEWLKAQGVKFGASSYSRPAEQMPTDALAILKNQKDGAVLIVPMDGNSHIVKLIGTVSSPMAYEQAKPLIQTFLVNSEGQALIKSELARMKEKAKIEYVGAFASKPSSSNEGTPAEAKPAEKNNSHIEKGVVGLD
jgi:EpsD family peptidyl-prolyl cis-trans isomerase